MSNNEVRFDPAVELVPGRLYALGGMMSLDGPIHWVPKSARGYQPINCYVLLEGKKALLIDTGIPLHRAQIIKQLEQVLPEDVELSLYFTRAEMDVVGNSGAVASRFALKSTVAGGSYNPFDAFDQIISPEGEDRSAATRNQVLQRVRGGNIAVGGDRSIEIVAPPFKMLALYWAYDAATETMFTSDIFGQHISQSGTYQPVATLQNDQSTAESVSEFMAARFWWMKDIDPEPLRGKLDAIFEKYKISRIAPTHGCVVEGKEQVERHFQMMRQFLSKNETSADSKKRISA